MLKAELRLSGRWGETQWVCCLDARSQAPPVRTTHPEAVFPPPRVCTFSPGHQEGRPLPSRLNSPSHLDTLLNHLNEKKRIFEVRAKTLSEKCSGLRNQQIITDSQAKKGS